MDFDSQIGGARVLGAATAEAVPLLLLFICSSNWLLLWHLLVVAVGANAVVNGRSGRRRGRRGGCQGIAVVVIVRRRRSNIVVRRWRRLWEWINDNCY
jgi:hypothetical protein